MCNARCQLSDSDHLIILKHLEFGHPLLGNVDGHEEQLFNIASGVLHREDIDDEDPVSGFFFRTFFLISCGAALHHAADALLSFLAEIKDIPDFAARNPYTSILDKGLVHLCDHARGCQFRQIVTDAVECGLHLVPAGSDLIHPCVQFQIHVLIGQIVHEESNQNCQNHDQNRQIGCSVASLHVNGADAVKPGSACFITNIMSISSLNALIQDIIQVDMVRIHQNTPIAGVERLFGFGILVYQTFFLQSLTDTTAVSDDTYSLVLLGRCHS